VHHFLAYHLNLSLRVYTLIRSTSEMATADRMFAQGPSAPPPAGYPGGGNDGVPPNYPPNYDAEAGTERGSGDVTLGTADTKVRLGFLRKVYGMLTFCLAVTVGVACAFSFIDPVRNYVVTHPWLLYIGLAVGLVSYCALVCFRPKKPWNALMLALFVAGFSLMIGVICASYFAAGWGKVVIQAFVATVCIFVSLTAYVLITKKDFSYLGGFLLAAVIALIVLSILTFVTSLFVGQGTRRFLYFGVSVLGTLVYTGFILYDTSLILHKYGPDDWIQGVVSLYVDCKLSHAHLFRIHFVSLTNSLCFLFSHPIVHVPPQHHIVPPNVTSRTHKSLPYLNYNYIVRVDPLLKPFFRPLMRVFAIPKATQSLE